MKKVLVLLLCFSLVFCLCGCSFKDFFSAETAGYTATALGFDEKNGKISVFLETVTVNSEDAEADAAANIISGEGKTVKSAMEQIYKKSAQPLMLSHIGIAVAGQSVSAKRFEEILDFCYDMDKITLSMQWVATQSAEKLLSCKPASSIAVGYGILSMLNQQTSRTGTEFKNRFYEVEAVMAQPLRITALPYFKVEDESFYYDGVQIYENATPKIRLNSKQASLYAVAVNAQSSGTLFLDDKNYKIKSSYSKFTFENGFKNVTLYIDTDTDKNAKAKIKKGIEELFASSKYYNSDIFAIGNVIYRKKPKEWKKAEEDYKAVYQNMRLTVEIK